MAKSGDGNIYPQINLPDYNTASQNNSATGSSPPYPDPPEYSPSTTPASNVREPISVALPDKPGQDIPPEYNFGENHYVQYVPIGQPMEPKMMQFNQRGRMFAADFYPACLQAGNKSRSIGPVFEPFSFLIRQANYWLSQNSILEIVSCTSVERDCSVDGVIDTVNSVRHESAYGMRLFVRGLRLWMRQPQPGEAAQSAKQIWYINVMPRYLGQMASSPYFEVSMCQGANFRGTLAMSAQFCLPQFENLKITLQKFSESLKTTPLQGEIKTIEILRHSLPMRATGPLDLDQSYWSELISERRTYINCFRIFYIQGAPTQPSLDLEMFNPDIKFRSGVGRPLIEDFNTVSSRAMSWALGHPLYRITDIQTVPCFANYLDDCSNKALYKPPDPYRSLHVAYTNQSIHVVSTLAMAYVDMTGQPAAEKLPFATGINTMSCRTFVPCKSNKHSYESVPETIVRIGDWLNASNSLVANMETIEVYHNPDYHNVRFNEMGTLCAFGSGMKKLSCYRFYFYGACDEPNPALLPPIPAVNKKRESSDACQSS